MIRLIVNADDYGYFRCVSRGILDLARRGRVTATGVMANGPEFEACVADLPAVPTLDCGVHLNATWGRPLTDAFRRYADRFGGTLPGKFRVARDVVQGALDSATVVDEWRAQIRRCEEAGIRPVFLNSHEHLHMLPALWRGVCALADEFRIAHVRRVDAEWRETRGSGGLLRNALMGLLGGLAGRRGGRPAPGFLGLGPSGRIGMAYLDRALGRLPPGGAYELMCHPGRFDPAEIDDPALRAYHDWEGEYGVFASDAFAASLARHGVCLSGYRER